MRYRCKHFVEAMRWRDTDELREMFANWFDDVSETPFETRGPIVVMPEVGEAIEGEWIVWSDGEFLVMSDEMFRDFYEAVP